jgi:Cytochrome B6-F complex subunit VI (PetL)
MLSGALAYILLLGGAYVVALGLFFAFRAIKLI